MMNILIVDFRESEPSVLRVKSLKAALEALSHVVRVIPHVTGGRFYSKLANPYEDWPELLRALAENEVKDVEFVFMHVGRDQLDAQQAVENIYREKHAILYSGAKLPDWCLHSPRPNEKHARIMEVIDPEFAWPESLLHSVSAAPGSIAQGGWQTVRNALEKFDEPLERKLTILHGALSRGVSIPELRELRVRELGS